MWQGREYVWETQEVWQYLRRNDVPDFEGSQLPNRSLMIYVM